MKTIAIFASTILLSGCAIFDTVALLDPAAADAIAKAEKSVTAEAAQGVEEICNRVSQADIDAFVASVNASADEGDRFNGITCAVN